MSRACKRVGPGAWGEHATRPRFDFARNGGGGVTAAEQRYIAWCLAAYWAGQDGPHRCEAWHPNAVTHVPGIEEASLEQHLIDNLWQSIAIG